MTLAYIWDSDATGALHDTANRPQGPAPVTGISPTIRSNEQKIAATLVLFGYMTAAYCAPKVFGDETFLMVMAHLWLVFVGFPTARVQRKDC